MATALPLVNVTVRLVDQDGDPVIGAKVSAKLMTVERYKGYVIPEEYLGVTDEQGTCIVRLFPNELGTEGSEYRFKISYPKTSNGKSLPSCHIGGSSCYSQGGKSLTVYASIPNADCNLEDVCDLDPYPIRGSGQIFTEQVLSAAEAAKKAAQDVENIKPDIEAAKQAAIIATTKASIATSEATTAGLKADESASKASESSSWASRAKAWAESTSIPDPDEPASKSAKSWAEEAKTHNDQMPVTATGTTTPRPIADRFVDVVNIKDFGAKGDGVTDDTAAWNAWQEKLKTGGIGYIPSGSYLIDGKVREFKFGAFGNAIDWPEFSSEIFSRDKKFWPEGWLPLLRQHVEYPNYKTFGPLIDLSFTAYNEAQKVSGRDGASGPQGISIRSVLNGVGNAMQANIKSYAVNNLAGKGDCVAISGCVKKLDIEDGTSMACGVTAAAEQHSTKSGVVICLEAGPKQMVPLEPNPNSMPIGPVIGQHLHASSPNPVHAMSLYAGPSDGQYGCYNAIQITRTFFDMPGGTAGAPGTTAINCYGWDREHHPEKALQFGYCPAHIQMRPGYDFNVKTVKTNFKPLEDGQSCFVDIGQTGDLSNHGLTLSHDGDTQWSIITGVTGRLQIQSPLKDQSGNSKSIVASLNYNGTQKNFFVVSPESSAVYQEAGDGQISIGKASSRWSQLYAASGAINTSDEREKQNIKEYPDDVLDAWGDVQFRQFAFNDAVLQKGATDARLHSGVIAQQVVKAFSDHGLDAARYGLLCFDRWEDEYEEFEVVDVPASELIVDSNGNPFPAQTHIEKRLVTKAGERYGIRYSEALCMEAAYQRRRADRLEQRIAALEEAIKKS